MYLTNKAVIFEKKLSQYSHVKPKYKINWLLKLENQCEAKMKSPLFELNKKNTRKII
jgi:hypothetical protein